MFHVRKFHVLPRLPRELTGLRELAHNLYWTWDYDVSALFRRLDRDYWDECGQNPVMLLGNLDQKLLEMRAKDDGYLSHLKRAKAAFADYLSNSSWFEKSEHEDKSIQIAFFSMEYGLATCLPIYSGGLGVLSADHLKSASDLGLPLVGVGLLYHKGYFQQYLSRDGWQQEFFGERELHNMPIRLEKDDNNEPLKISVEFDGRRIFAQIWRVDVGKVALYLLDTYIPENAPEDQKITNKLYGGDSDLRIKQEILLGVGGIRALVALGKTPDVCHMNEGHSAFLALERTRMAMEEYGLTFWQALEGTRGSNLFTSHTPVSAGIDEFDNGLIDRYLGKYYASLSLSMEEFHELGGSHLPQTSGKFNMAIFAINMSGYYNGVSRLHGKVARKMWSYLWPNVPEQEIPIGHITNGIHFRTWISDDIAQLLDRYLGSKWYQDPANEAVWARVNQIPDEELWRSHERCREQLVSFARTRLQKQLANSGASQLQINQAKEVLDPEALTIGFARRFAEYKRAYLLFRNRDRLAELLNSKDKPVQLIFSGKAHPKDDIGKSIIRDIINAIRNEGFRNKIVFIEDYNLTVASYLVQGVDVWLNNPRRPREASGTSGMKAAANGALNLSVLDGWWDEAYDSSLGWAIGRGEEYPDSMRDEQDRLESEALYHLLENEIIPIFYDRGTSGMPRRWVQMMKNCIRTLGPKFNTNRMVRQYCENYYIPAAARWRRFQKSKMKTAKELAAWKDYIFENWEKIKFIKVVAEDGDALKVTEKFTVEAWLNVDGIAPDDLSVQVYFGHLDPGDQIVNGQFIEMELAGKEAKTTFRYRVEIPCQATGQHGYGLRVLPKHPELTHPYEMGLITWDTSDR
jgi:starch phosphorylase